MASAWGASWGSAWLAAWGTIGTPVVPEAPPVVNELLSAGRGGRVLHRNSINQWSSIQTRERRQRQLEDDRAILECLEHFLAVMEES